MAKESIDNALSHVFVRYAKPADVDKGGLSYATFVRLAEDTALLNRLTARETDALLSHIRPQNGDRIRFRDFLLIVGLIATQSDRRVDPDTAYIEMGQRMLRAYIGKFPFKLPPGLEIPRKTDYRPTTVVSTTPRRVSAPRSERSVTARSGALTPTNPSRSTSIQQPAAARSQSRISVERRDVAVEVRSRSGSEAAVQADFRAAASASRDSSTSRASSIEPVSAAVFTPAVRAVVQDDTPVVVHDLAPTDYLPHGLAEAARRVRAHLHATTSNPESLCHLMKLPPQVAVLFNRESLADDHAFWLGIRRLSRTLFPATKCPIVAEELAFQRIFDKAMQLDIVSESDFELVQ